jgi:hypothetical protein
MSLLIELMSGVTIQQAVSQGGSGFSLLYQQEEDDF